MEVLFGLVFKWLRGLSQHRYSRNVDWAAFSQKLFVVFLSANDFFPSFDLILPWCWNDSWCFGVRWALVRTESKGWFTFLGKLVIVVIVMLLRKSPPVPWRVTASPQQHAPSRHPHWWVHFWAGLSRFLQVNTSPIALVRSKIGTHTHTRNDIYLKGVESEQKIEINAWNFKGSRIEKAIYFGKLKSWKLQYYITWFQDLR